ncbi:WD40 repeat domain-containing protein [Nostoc sp.]|uniref:WD40 repeat domain-containing protein n=1 Tax=Nostoc sp. TaxID=1180 RepID=UPI0035934DDC
MGFKAIAKGDAVAIATMGIGAVTQLPETWRCVRTLKSHLAAVNAIAISPDDTTSS